MKILAARLPSLLQKSIEKMMRKKTARTIRMRVALNKSLIGIFPPMGSFPRNDPGRFMALFEFSTGQDFAVDRKHSKMNQCGTKGV